MLEHSDSQIGRLIEAQFAVIMQNCDAISTRVLQHVHNAVDATHRGEIPGLPELLRTVESKLTGLGTQILEKKDTDSILQRSVLKDLYTFTRLQYDTLQSMNADPLTGLPMRRMLKAHFQRSIHNTQRSRHAESTVKPKHTGILLVDVDHFKSVNDTYGHDVGDTVLQQVARHLKQSCRDSDIVIRYGGEEFIVLLTEMNNPQGAQIAGQRLIDSLRVQPILYNDFEPDGGSTLNVTASIGCSVYPSDTLPLEMTDSIDADAFQEKMISQADVALYTAKDGGRDCVVTYQGHT